jgi:hypothetical protein
MIKRRISADFHNDQNEYYDYLLNLLQTTYARNISQWSECPSADESRYLACSTAWINEDIELNCEQVYRDENDQPMSSSKQFHLSQTYYNTRIVTVEQRLIQGGVRLGVVISRIVELQKHKHHEKEDDEVCLGTLLLFMVILIEVVLAFFCLIYYLVRRTLYQQPSSKVPLEYNILNDAKV